MITIILMSAFLKFWIGFTMIAVSAILLVVFWAISNKQFSDQDRARYLPLESHIPEDEDEDEDEDEGLKDEGLKD